MIDTLLYIFLAVLGCIICAAPAYLYRLVCRALRIPLCWLRGCFRWVNWEKVSMFALSGSLILVTGLTTYAAWGASPSADSGLDTGIYEGLRVVYSVLEGDSLEFRSYMTNCSNSVEGTFWGWFLRICSYVLPVLVPLSTLCTAAILLWNRLPHHVPFFSRSWYIFSELDANSIRMAKSIQKDLETEKDTGVFIFLRTRRGDQSPEILDDLRNLNYCLYPKTEARFLRLPHRRLRTMRFFFLSENTDKNFERMQDFLTTAQDKKLFFPVGKSKNDVFQQELYLLSETESAPMLIDHLRNMMKGVECFRNTELRLLDRYRAISYDLLREKPLHRHIQDGRLNILVLGFGKIGREFFRAACSLTIFPDCETEFTICDLQITEKLAMFESQCPELRASVAIDPQPLNAETDALDKLLGTKDYHYIVVALGDDERNIRVVSRLKRSYRLRHWERLANKHTDNPHPQICVNIEDAIKHDYTKKLWEDASKRENVKPWDNALHVFGGLDQVFTQRVLMPRSLWNAARFIHRELNLLSSDALLNWVEYERRSSIASAVRAEYLSASHPKASPEKLADTEHLRWMAYVRSEGLRYVDTELVDVYYDSKNGRHVDILGKLTPCLTEKQSALETVWNHLSKGPHAANYAGQLSFRKRDKELVKLADEIANRARPPKS